MNRTVLALSVALGLSLVVNAMALHRLSSREAPKPEPSKAATAPRVPDRSGEAPPPTGPGVPDTAKLDRLIRDVAEIRRGLDALRPGGPPAGLPPPASPSPGDPPSSVSESVDPLVAGIIAEQERFETLWKDLKAISNVRGQLENEAYVQAVLDSTAGYLLLAEPARSRFIGVAKSIAMDAQRLAKQYEEERKAVVFNRENPQASRDQWEAISKKYKTEVTAASDRLKTQLDLSQPAHKQFSAKSETWITTYLAPDWGRGWERGWRGPDRN